MNIVKASYRLPESLVQAMDTIARQKGISRTDLITDACRMYCDLMAVQQPDSYLPQWAVQQIRGICGDLQTQLNNRSNQLLSSIAIQLTVLQLIVADSLEVSESTVREYTAQAVANLKRNNRVFQLDEFLE